MGVLMTSQASGSASEARILKNSWIIAVLALVHSAFWLSHLGGTAGILVAATSFVAVVAVTLILAFMWPTFTVGVSWPQTMTLVLPVVAALCLPVIAFSGRPIEGVIHALTLATVSLIWARPRQETRESPRTYRGQPPVRGSSATWLCAPCGGDVS